jgi:hypothetical protein
MECWMNSDARDRLRLDRTAGAALALSVQVIFLLLVLLSTSHQTQRAGLPPESILLIPPLALPAPTTIDARGPRRRRTPAPALVPVPPPIVAPPAPTTSLAPPSGLAGFGRSLFGCAPERYAELAPDERAHCPKPGEGLARNDDRDLVTPPRSRAKLEAMWQEKWEEDHWVPGPCPPSDRPAVLCLLDQTIAENRRAATAWDKIAEDRAAALKPKPLVPPPFRRESI